MSESTEADARASRTAQPLSAMLTVGACAIFWSVGWARVCSSLIHAMDELSFRDFQVPIPLIACGLACVNRRWRDTMRRVIVLDWLSDAVAAACLFSSFCTVLLLGIHIVYALPIARSSFRDFGLFSLIGVAAAAGVVYVRRRLGVPAPRVRWGPRFYLDQLLLFVLALGFAGMIVREAACGDYCSEPIMSERIMSVGKLVRDYRVRNGRFPTVSRLPAIPEGIHYYASASQKPGDELAYSKSFWRQGGRYGFVLVYEGGGAPGTTETVCMSVQRQERWSCECKE